MIGGRSLTASVTRVASGYIESIEGVSDLQARAYAKTGLTEDNIEPLLDYMIRLQLSDIKHFKDESYGEGLVGYVNKMLDIHPRGEVGSLGYLATDKIREMLKTLDITQEFDFGGKRTLKAKFKDYDEATDIVRLDVSLATGTDAPSMGVLSIDLTGIPSAIDSLVNEIDEKYVQTVDDNGIYAVSTLQKDVNNLATTIVLAVGKEPLDSNDSNSSLLNILNEAYQAYIHGDEHSFVWPGLGIGSADELAQKRADWRKLLESDAFADKERCCKRQRERLKRHTRHGRYKCCKQAIRSACGRRSSLGGAIRRSAGLAPGARLASGCGCAPSLALGNRFEAHIASTASNW